MSHRFSKLIALTTVSAALAIGGAGVAQASPDHGGQKHDHHAACKSVQGKKKSDCGKHDAKHSGKHDGKNHR
jgi:hypothetical protein